MYQNNILDKLHFTIVNVQVMLCKLKIEILAIKYNHFNIIDL